MARRDVEAMVSHWREDGVDDMVPVGLLRGRDEMREYFKSVFAATPDASSPASTARSTIVASGSSKMSMAT
jgi:hypothetical protein